MPGFLLTATFSEAVKAAKAPKETWQAADGLASLYQR